MNTVLWLMLVFHVMRPSSSYPRRPVSLTTESPDSHSDNVVPRSYHFGYQFSDGEGMLQERHESSHKANHVEGGYFINLPNGLYRKVEYRADKYGYRAVIRSNEPGLANQNTADAIYIVEPPPSDVLYSHSSNNSTDILNQSIPHEVTSQNLHSASTLENITATGSSAMELERRLWRLNLRTTTEEPTSSNGTSKPVSQSTSKRPRSIWRALARNLTEKPEEYGIKPANGVWGPVNYNAEEKPTNIWRIFSRTSAEESEVDDNSSHPLFAEEPQKGKIYNPFHPHDTDEQDRKVGRSDSLHVPEQPERNVYGYFYP